MDISKFTKGIEPAARVEPPEDQLADAMHAAGIDPPEYIEIDGRLHRFPGENGRKSKDAWYIVYPDGIPAGRFGCWRRDISHTFRADVGHELTPGDLMAERRKYAEAKKWRDAERKKYAEIAANACEAIWKGAAFADADHPYLQKKGVDPHGLRITGDGRLIAPIYVDGELSSLQYIDENGKRFHGGAVVEGGLWIIGKGMPRYICEGFATAATVAEATGEGVAIAYTSGNMPAVASKIVATFGSELKTPLVIVADKDSHGVGERCARKAAEHTGARVVVSPVDSDVNDYAQQGGDVKALLMPPDAWLMPADEMTVKPAPIRWLIKHWLQSEATIMVHGPSGAGKTFVVLDMAASISSGKDEWRGHKVNAGAVVYLAGEGHHGLRGRLAAWRQENGGASLGEMWLSKSGCELNTPRGYSKAVEHIRMLPQRPALVIVDTLHRFLEGDENSAQDAKTMLDACAGITSEFGCSVLLVHHTGVSDEAQHRARGSSAWRGALDIEISVCNQKIEQKKSKDSEQAAPLYFALQSVEIDGWIDEDGDPVTSAIAVEGDEPAPRAPKIDKRLSDAMGLIEAAWWGHAGQDVDAGAPYISRSAMRAKLEETGKASRTVENELNPAYKNKTIGRLIDAGVISAHQNGWIITDEVMASALMLRREKDVANPNG